MFCDCVSSTNIIINDKPRIAICMRGAVAKTNKSFLMQNQLYDTGEYVDYEACYNSIVRHIITPNAEKYEFDFFCQGWNLDLEDDIARLYRPVRRLFEDNREYNEEISARCSDPGDFSGVSQALAMQKSIDLAVTGETVYEKIILYRYDVFLWKDMHLDEYNGLDERIYVNAHNNGNGDFHFVMNPESATTFRNLYDSVYLGNRAVMHFWIQNFVVNFMQKEMKMDDIVPGSHQEVIRKIAHFTDVMTESRQKTL